jgi:hypothetical protein
MRNFFAALLVGMAVIALVAGTVATANKRRTALHGPALPAISRSWNADNDAQLVARMRDYLRDIGR